MIFLTCKIKAENGLPNAENELYRKASKKGRVMIFCQQLKFFANESYKPNA